MGPGRRAPQQRSADQREPIRERKPPGERDEGSARFPVAPWLADQALLLGVLADSAGERQNRDRGADDQRGCGRIYDGVYRRPQDEAPQHRVTSDREHPARLADPRDGRAAGGESGVLSQRPDEQDRAQPHQQRCDPPAGGSRIPQRCRRGCLGWRIEMRHRAERGDADQRIDAQEPIVTEPRDQPGAKRMRHQQMRADERGGCEPEERQRGHLRYASGKFWRSRFL